MYKFLAKYAYEVEVLARVPDIIELLALTRDGVVAVLARTARLERTLFVVFPRAETPRATVDVFTALAAPVVRELTVLDAEPAREFADLDATVVLAVFARFVVVARGLVLPV